MRIAIEFITSGNVVCADSLICSFKKVPCHNPLRPNPGIGKIDDDLEFAKMPRETPVLPPNSRLAAALGPAVNVMEIVILNVYYVAEAKRSKYCFCFFVCPSVRLTVCPSVRLSVCPSVSFFSRAYLFYS